MRSVLLVGRKHTETGAVATDATGDVAVAMTRGGALKTYQYTDPNEDVALAAQGTHGRLVVVADGHWGHEASEAALIHVLAAHAEPFTEGPGRSGDAWYQEVLMALVEANDAVLTRHASDRNPRTTLSLGLARPDEDVLVLASVGDSHIFRVTEDQATDFGFPSGASVSYLGNHQLAASALERDARIVAMPLAGTRALVAATDGLSEPNIGVADPPTVVANACASVSGGVAERASVAARAIVAAAVGAQIDNAAGDNIAVAVAWLGDS